jgi:hypothetical protein
MGWRDRLADIITGGALTEARERLKWAERDVDHAWDRAELTASHLLRLRAEDATDRLSRIAAMETPNANATVRRMARIARGEE